MHLSDPTHVKVRMGRPSWTPKHRRVPYHAGSWGVREAGKQTKKKCFVTLLEHQQLQVIDPRPFNNWKMTLETREGGYRCDIATTTRMRTTCNL